MADSDADDIFAQEAQELLQWPYTFHAIEDTLSASLIEARAKQILFQALNQKSAVAFAGSGLSLAFGRLGWEDWQRRQFHLVREIAGAFVECSKASEKLIGATKRILEFISQAPMDALRVRKGKSEDRDYAAIAMSADAIGRLDRFLKLKSNEVRFHRLEAEKLSATLSSLDSPGHFVGGEGPPVVFQVAAKLQDVLRNCESVFLAPRRQERDERTSGKHNVHDLVINGARFGFREDAKKSPAPTVLIDQIAFIPEAILEWLRERSAAGEYELEDISKQEDKEKVREIVGDCGSPERAENFAGTVLDFAKSFVAFRLALIRYGRVLAAPDARLSLTNMAKVLLVDELAHAENIVRNSVEYSTNSGRLPWKEYCRELRSKQLGKPHLEGGDGVTRPDGGGEAADGLSEIVLLNRKLRGMAPAAPEERLSFSARGMREFHERYHALGYFRTTNFEKLIEVTRGQELSTEWTVALDLLNRELEENSKNGKGQRRDVRRAFISPTHRFEFEMLAARFADPYKDLRLNSSAAKRSLTDSSRAAPAAAGGPLEPGEVEKIDFQSRRSVIDAELDPLEIVVQQLGIKRFLTTNYDLEIERFYQDNGYKPFPATDPEDGDRPAAAIRHREHDSYNFNGLGGIFRDNTFRREQATDLIAFALDQESADAHVFHLHGRATVDAKIVATERDYMDLYLRQDRYREMVDESIRIGFAANPLVFLGLGMQEADVLRPLRQFMSDRDRAVNRTAVVLYPGLDDISAQEKFAATLFLRYGAHTIHFGHAMLDLGGGLPSAGVNWLHHAVKLIKLLTQTNQEMRDLLVAALKTLKGEKLTSEEKRIKTGFVEERRKKEPSGFRPEPKERLDAFRRAMGETALPEPGGSGSTVTWQTLDLMLGAREASESISSLDAHFERAAPGGTEPEEWTDGCGLVPPRFLARSIGEQAAALRKEAMQEIGPSLAYECGLLAQLLRMSVKTSFQEVMGKTEESRLRTTAVLLEMSKSLPDDEKTFINARIREFNSRIVGLNGLQNAIITGALCASLTALQWERQRWWRYWQLSPPHRVARFDMALPPSRKDVGGQVYVPRRYFRHRLATVITDLDGSDWIQTPPDLSSRVLGGGENEAPTSVRSFDSFLNALERRMKKDADAGSGGRRWHCVVAHRGVGRGAFFSAFQTVRGLGQYIASSWPEAKPSEAPVYIAAIFINLSFSTEVASTFDMLADALLDAVVILEAAASQEQAGRSLAERIQEKAGQGSTALAGVTEKGLRDDHEKILRPLSRLRRLARLLDSFKSAAGSAGAALRPRVLICLSGIDLLCYPGGLPKNREIEDFLSLITSPERRDYPYDLVLISNEENLGETLLGKSPIGDAYRHVIKEFETSPSDSGRLDTPAVGTKPTEKTEALPPENTVYIPMVRARIDQKGVQNVERRMARSRIPFAPNPKERSGTRFALDAPDPQDLPEGVKVEDVCYVHFARVVKPASLLIDNFQPLATIMFLAAAIAKPEIPDAVSEGILTDFRIPGQRVNGYSGPPDHLGSLDEAWGRDTLAACHEAHTELRRDRRKRVFAALNEFRTTGTLAAAVGGSRPDASPEDEKACIEMLVEHFDESARREWNDFRRVLSGNRYCLTILFSAAQRHAVSGRTIKDGARRARAFFRKVTDQVNAVSASRREETVLEEVLAAFKAFHVTGEPHNDLDLHMIILRHLAVIGGPCSADVLVRMPEFLDFFDNLPENRERSRILRLTQAMTVLAERGLIFRLDPHPMLSDAGSGASHLAPNTDPATDGGDANTRKMPNYAYRYTLHRLMQRHILLKMGSGPREFVEINSFAPSLYASMPADLPRLNHESYRFLHTLIDSLSQYPDRRADDPAGASWHLGGAAYQTRVQALRCALSIVRSSFSVAVVSRFEDYKDLERSAERPPRGYFEAYRIQVRWLIRKAWELLKLSGEGTPETYEPDQQTGQLNALYRDEIVWLYNECGLICLVQGNLLEAASLLRQAIRFNRGIEGEIDGGGQHNRISLNLAIVQIERGRLEIAYRRLQAICESESREGSSPGHVWHIAHGYLGLIYHLRGDPENASAHYRRAVAVLRIFEDLRSCSIFSRHFADLERLRGNLEFARRLIRDAISFAQAGGHEDLHKRARLSRILLDIAEHRTGGSSNHSIIGQIKLVEDYAETMEMPSLLCDAYVVQAKLLREQGETTLAGTILSRALALAKRNGMNLRLNSALTSYARVLGMRGLRDQCNQLLLTCMDIAKRNNNQLEIARAELAFDETHQIREPRHSGDTRR